MAVVAVAGPGAGDLPAGASLDRVAHGTQALLTGAPGADDGFIETGGTIDPAARVPAIARLDPALRAAVQDAAAAARADGVILRVSSGWRSAAYQGELLERATRTYGSPEEAARFVLPPERSEHVRGAAVDIGPTDAALWLGQHGARFGLCQTYANELWHFELATEPGGTCPAQRSDPTQG